MYFVSQYGVYQQVHLNPSLLIHLPQPAEIRKLKLRPETCARSNFQCRTGGNLTTKLRTETCVAQKPKHNKGRGLSLDKLNTIILDHLCSQQLDAGVSFNEIGSDSFLLLSVASILSPTEGKANNTPLQEIIIAKEDKIHKRYYSFY